MAEGIVYRCTSCARSVEAWSDGNPYYLDEAGEKQYAYHPNHEDLARCIGNDDPHLCLSCGAEQMVDSRDPHTACRACGAEQLHDTWRLEGKDCPWCAEGVLRRDPRVHMIS